MKLTALTEFLFSSKGRISRKPFWLGCLSIFALTLILVFFGIFTGATGDGFAFPDEFGGLLRGHITLVDALVRSIAIIAGLFCARLRAATRVGLGFVVVYATLLVLLFHSRLGDPNINTAYFLGQMTGVGFRLFILTMVGHFIRRGVVALFNRKRAYRA